MRFLRLVAPSDGMSRAIRPWGLWTLAVLWLSGAVGGLWIVWAADNTAGAAARPPEVWPRQSGLRREADRPTLILLAHPRCTCTNASLGELREVLACTQSLPHTYVVFLKPDGVADGWERTPLWQLASTLPNTTVVRDDQGAVARHFGALTSGQTLLYDARGHLTFSGGITGSRGHEGENAGRVQLIAALGGNLGSHGTSVFGCPLFSVAAGSERDAE